MTQEQNEAAPEVPVEERKDDQSPPAPVENPALDEPQGAREGKKRKVALFVVYVGHGYKGMQRNPGTKTIEDDLFKAIHKAGGISDANADERGPVKVSASVFSLQLGKLFFATPFHLSRSLNCIMKTHVLGIYDIFTIILLVTCY